MNTLYKLIAAILLWNVAGAEEGYYAGATGGLVIPKDLVYIADLDFGWRGGIFAGYQFANHVRVEGELAYSRYRMPTGWTDSLDMSRAKVHAESFAAVGNGLYEIPLGNGFSPYFGAGIGYGRYQITVKFPEEPSEKFKHDCFVWQGIVGIAYAFDRYTWAIDYRNIHFGNHFSDHTMNLSVSRSF